VQLLQKTHVSLSQQEHSSGQCWQQRSNRTLGERGETKKEKENQSFCEADLTAAIEKEKEQKSHHHKDRERHIDTGGDRGSHPLKVGSQDQCGNQASFDSPQSNASTIRQQHPDGR